MASDPQGQGIRRRRGGPSNVYDAPKPVFAVHPAPKLDKRGRPTGKTVHQVVEHYPGGQGFYVHGEHSDPLQAHQRREELEQSGGSVWEAGPGSEGGGGV